MKSKSRAVRHKVIVSLIVPGQSTKCWIGRDGQNARKLSDDRSVSFQPPSIDFTSVTSSPEPLEDQLFVPSETPWDWDFTSFLRTSTNNFSEGLLGN
jgi:hypothetical protein